jgi:hypothetical protein
LSRRILCLLAWCGFSLAAAWGQTATSRFNFNAGGGFAFGNGDVGKFTDTSYNAVAGGGLNLNHTLGVRAEYMYYNLAIKDSVKQFQGLQGASGNLQSITLNGFANFPVSGRWEVYGIGGGGFYRRSVSAPSKFLAANTVWQPAWIWWGITHDDNNLVSPAQTLSSHAISAGGFNFGGGITYRVPNFHHVKLYAEARYHRAYTGTSHTTVFPVTFGVRW